MCASIQYCHWQSLMSLETAVSDRNLDKSNDSKAIMSIIGERERVWTV